MRRCSMYSHFPPSHVLFHTRVSVQEFFLTVKDLLRKQPQGVDSYLKFADREKQLLSR